ncbi:hypothetical protein LIER_19959 [Lithospermum erythrorhizon]|uniref:Uncharacterized protein n=1 Tax=Lithospermum erythrorhizon TaxID=34254 RepID=A0AAV3QNX8_LITER
MSGNNIHNNETHIPSQNNLPNEQNRPQYLADVEAEIRRRVNEELARALERTNQSCRYTHFSREGSEYEGSEAYSAQNNLPKRRTTAPAVPLRYLQLRAMRLRKSSKRSLKI